MADGVLMIELDLDLAERVRGLAAATGSPVEALVRGAVADYVSDWSVTVRRLAEAGGAGVSVDANAALDRFETAVAARVSHRT
jgi:hypothetical protein